MIAAVPSPAPVLLASSGSRMRQFAGYSPACRIIRTARDAAKKSGKRTAHPARKRGLSCSRIHASVITPSVPSEPMNRRSGLGPAPDPGSRRVSIAPRGVTTRRLSTKSSMCVCSVAKCPPERVAIQPPSVEYSKLCGKCRRLSPCGLSCASSAGPSAPAWIRAAREARSTSITRSIRRRSIITAALWRWSSMRGSTPPTTLLPAPKGVSDACTLPAQSITVTSSPSLRG